MINSKIHISGERIDKIIDWSQGSLDIKIITLSFLLINLYLVFKGKYFIPLLSFIFISCLLTIFARKKKKTKRILPLIPYNGKMEPGDFLIFETNYSWDIPEFLFYRLIGSLFCKHTFSHIGILVHYIDGLYLLHNQESPALDLSSKQIKNGGMVVNIDDAVRNYKGDIYLVKTNLGPYIANMADRDIDKYAKIKFSTGLSSSIIAPKKDECICTHFLYNILSDHNLMKKNISYICDLINPKYYKVPFKVKGMARIK